MKSGIQISILAGFLFLLNTGRVFGWQTPPLIRAENGKISVEPTGRTEKYLHALSVYEKLVRARGDSRYPVPKFVMSRATSQVAWMNYDSLEIGLEEKAYDVCAKYPDKDAAIAILLGHELTHYYEKHAWRRGFAADYHTLNMKMRIDTVQDAVAYETQADYLGGFLAYSAGYGMFSKADTLLSDLYAAYKRSPNISGYPVLSDRMELSRRTYQKLQSLVDAFEMANLLTSVGRYADARVYFKYVLRSFQSPEIYNNAGVCALLEAISLFNPSALKYRYPVEIDLRTRTTRGVEDADKKRNRLIREALQNFDAALNMSPEYAVAWLNKAVAHSLLNTGEELKRAQFYAEVEGLAAAEKSKAIKTASDLRVLLGILAAGNGDQQRARQLFEKEAPNNKIAAENLNIMLATPPPPREELTEARRTESIDNISLAAFAQTKKYDPKLKVLVDENAIFYQYQPPGAGIQSRILFHHDQVSDKFIFFNLTKPGYTGKTAGEIGLGASAEDIESAYDPPLRTLETPVGRMMIYEDILFILDETGKLKQWVTFLEK